MEIVLLVQTSVVSVSHIVNCNANTDGAEREKRVESMYHNCLHVVH